MPLEALACNAKRNPAEKACVSPALSRSRTCAHPSAWWKQYGLPLLVREGPLTVAFIFLREQGCRQSLKGH